MSDTNSTYNLKFNKENIAFYSNINSQYPDKIEITIVYSDFDENLKEEIIDGIDIFMNRYLGDLISVIDNMTIIGKKQSEKELIPIEKLKDYLVRREKEFMEKYEGTRYNIQNDSYNSLEAALANGKPLLAIINSSLLEWNSKASHPWIMTIEIKYDGNDN